MPKLDFSDALFFVGTALTIVLLVLDKAGKLKGPLLLVLLALAAAMMLPVVIDNGWVRDAATTQLKISRGLLMVFLVGIGYSLLAVWISTGEAPQEQQNTSAAPMKDAETKTNQAPTPLKHSAAPQLQKTAKFSVMVPFDTKPDAFPIPLDTNPDDPLFRTYMDLHSLAQNGTIPDSVRESKDTGQITYNSRPVSMNESSDFLARLLQYYVLVSIDFLQRDSFRVSIGYPAKATAGIEPPDAAPYPYEKLSLALGDNRFFRPFLHRPCIQEETWRLKPMMMPKETVIEFEKKDERGRYAVKFTRPNYFKAEFVVEPFVGTGIGDLPKYFATRNPETVMQWSFIVRMNYSIARSETANYAPWLDSLYDGLSRKFTIPE